jgi:hypothetical protein
MYLRAQLHSGRYDLTVLNVDLQSEGRQLRSEIKLRGRLADKGSKYPFRFFLQEKKRIKDNWELKISSQVDMNLRCVLCTKDIQVSRNGEGTFVYVVSLYH